MAQITEKELSALNDLLGAEQLQITKYQAAAQKCNDTALADCYNQMAQRHQRHFDQLFTNLK